MLPSRIVAYCFWSVIATLFIASCLSNLFQQLQKQSFHSPPQTTGQSDLTWYLKCSDVLNTQKHQVKWMKGIHYSVTDLEFHCLGNTFGEMGLDVSSQKLWHWILKPRDRRRSLSAELIIEYYAQALILYLTSSFLVAFAWNLWSGCRVEYLKSLWDLLLGMW